jgi:hypothetical protein
MSRGPCTYKERDAAALVRAVIKGGCEVERVEVDRSGRIVVITKKGDGVQGDAGGNEWDEVTLAPAEIRSALGR